MYPKELMPGISVDPELAMTKQGAIEYDFSGEPDRPVIMSVHGGLGGYDQGRVMAAWVDPEKYRILSPSRPGYLGTPLASGATIEAQADLFAALLDYLHIDQVGVVCASAGGPPAYTFALRHPDRVWALIAVDSVSGCYTLPETAGPLAQALFVTGIGQKLTRFIEQKRPELFLKQLFQSEAYFTKEQLQKHIDDVLQSPTAMIFVHAFMETMFPYQPRKAGTDNDFDQYRKLSRLPLDKIRCPALIVHGTHDADVKFYDGVYAFETIPLASRYWIEEGDHLSFWLSPVAEKVQQAATDFLGLHCS